MINELLQIVAPHHCYGCGKTGPILCSNCKYDIVDDAFDGCIVCALPARSGICSACHTTYDAAWCVGDRHGPLQELIDGLKFKRVKSAGGVIADLLDARIPSLPEGTIIVPVPTVAGHVRQRGYDHTLLIARYLAKRRGLKCLSAVSRTDKHVQRGQNKRRRIEQAKEAFVCRERLNPTVSYLLIDDVVTTNATVRYAAQALKDAGAQTVWVAAAARQPLDK